MRSILIGLLGAMSAAAAAGGPASHPAGQHDANTSLPLDQPVYSRPATRWNDLGNASAPSPEECRDTVQKTRAANGQPELDRRTADADEPMVLWAVDRRQDGCSLLVTKGDATDVRPIPEVDGKVGLRPAQ